MENELMLKNNLSSTKIWKNSDLFGNKETKKDNSKWFERLYFTIQMLMNKE